MDRTNLLIISTDDISELDEMFGSEQDRLNMYNEMLSCNNEEPLTEWKSEVDDYALEVATDYYNDFFGEWGNLPVLCIAELGLWNGRRNGGLYGKLKELFGRATEDYNTLWYDKEHHCFLLKAVHHDGTNWFQFYALTNKGKSYLDNHPCCAEVHQHVLNTKGYIKQIKY